MHTIESHEPVLQTYPTPYRWSIDEFEHLCEMGIFADIRVKLVDGEIIHDSALAEPWRWSVEQYFQLHEGDIFREAHVQLIDGEILDMAAMNAPHANGVAYINYELIGVFGGRHAGFQVRVTGPLPMVASAPEPDAWVVSGNSRTYDQVLPTPAVVVLVVEVSDTSLWYDIGAKASLYASVGIADYWVIDIPNQQVRIFRDPQPDATQPFRFGYSQVTFHPRTDTISPLVMPNGMILVDDLAPQP